MLLRNTMICSMMRTELWFMVRKRDVPLCCETFLLARTSEKLRFQIELFVRTITLWHHSTWNTLRETAKSATAAAFRWIWTFISSATVTHFLLYRARYCTVYCCTNRPFDPTHFSGKKLRRRHNWWLRNGILRLYPSRLSRSSPGRHCKLRDWGWD